MLGRCEYCGGPSFPSDVCTMCQLSPSQRAFYRDLKGPQIRGLGFENRLSYLDKKSLWNVTEEEKEIFSERPPYGS